MSAESRRATPSFVEISMSKGETTPPDIRVDWLGGNCPVQAEGTINGRPFYFRARGNSWRMNIGGGDVVTEPEWSYDADYGTGPFDAGWMTQDQALTFIQQSAERFTNEQ